MSNSQMSNSQMSNNGPDKTVPIQEKQPRKHAAITGVLVAGLLIALGGDGYLIVRSNVLDEHIAQLQGATQDQMSKLSEATAALLDQRLQAMGTDVQSANSTASSAIKQARAEIQRQNAQLSRRLDQQQQQVTGELVELKDVTKTAASKLDEVSADVTGVKSDVTDVKGEVASTKSQMEKDGAQLKQVIGDMGVMSGLIATNGKDLQVLRELGERNYFEFDLRKGRLTQKLGDLTISLKRADPKRNRYTVEVLADDKRVEKKDKTINEPVQLYVTESRQPYEVVVNQIKKDEVIGYLATPKVKMARR